MSKSFGFGAIILHLKYEIVIRFLFLLLNGKVGVYLQSKPLHGNGWDTFSDQTVMYLGRYNSSNTWYNSAQFSKLRFWHYTCSTLSVPMTDSG